MASEPEVKSVVFVAGPAEIRGTTAYTFYLALALKQRGVHVEIFCPGGARFSDFENAGISITHADVIDRLVYDYFSMGALARKASETRPQLVHAQSPEVLSAADRFVKKLNVPLVVTVHDFLPEGRRFPLTQKKFLGVFPVGRPRLSGVAAVSDAVRTDLVTRSLVPKELIRVLPPGVDVEHLCRSRMRPREENRATFAIGTIGRLDKMKGHQYLIEAAKMLCDRKVDVQVVISGDGPDGGFFHQLTAELGMTDRVTFVAPAADNRAVFSSLDVFVMPSLREGLGHVVLEAMACGLPVVASGVGGVYSIINDGETGILVPQADTQALADALYRFVEDPDLAVQLGSAGQKSVRKNFNLDRLGAEMTEFYETVIEEHKAGVVS